MAKVKIKCLSRFKEENKKEGREKEDVSKGQSEQSLKKTRANHELYLW